MPSLYNETEKTALLYFTLYIRLFIRDVASVYYMFDKKLQRAQRENCTLD